MNSKSSKPALKAFFNSAAVQNLKRQLCDIGRRMWQREYVDGNGGNLAIRVGQDLALCTPTQVSKGFMTPADICLVDFDGNQLAGKKKRTSEILMHLQIMQRQPRAVATCHGHPPCSTGFAVAGILPQIGLVSEFELFVSLALAPYRTPGTPELGRLVASLAEKHNTILLANHGVVSWSHQNLEDAYFKMEILETHCRTILAAKKTGVRAKKIPRAGLRELLEIKRGFGIPDPRHG
jgi:L-fuculose-phosphate aldolase